MKALIVDDEPRALVNLEQMIATGHPGIFSAIATASDITSALAQLRRDVPDVLFLDIHLRDASGFDLLNQVRGQHFEVVFVTAYDDYAIKAIRLNAFDYLLKPIDATELDACIQRLSSGPHGQPEFMHTSTSPVMPQLKGNPDYIMLKDAYHYEKIPFTQICYLEASGPYTNIVYQKNNRLHKATKSKSLYEFEELLPPQDFIRIHRSYLINIRNAGKLVKKQDKFLIEAGAELLPVSRRRFSLIEAMIDGGAR